MMALLVLFIVSFIASSLMMHSSLQMSLLENRRNTVRLDFFNRGVIHWVQLLLLVDQNRMAATTLSDYWAVPLAHVPIEGGYVTGHIEDAQSHWNCNNLITNGKINIEQQKIFERLLQILHLKIDLASVLAQALFHDSFGHHQRTRPTILLDLSELAVLPSFSEDVIQKLRPYVIALPSYTKVNVNTAPAEVLASVIPGLDLKSVQFLISARDHAPFMELSALRILDKIIPDTGEGREHQHYEQTKEIILRSQYFLLSGFTERGENKAPITVLFRRGWRSPPSVIWVKRS